MATFNRVSLEQASRAIAQLVEMEAVLSFNTYVIKETAKQLLFENTCSYKSNNTQVCWSFLTSLAATFNPGVLDPGRTVVHRNCMQSHRALTSERRAATTQYTSFFSSDCFGKVRITRHMLEIVTSNHNVPGEIDDLCAHQSRHVSMRWGRDKRCCMVILCCPVQQ